MVNVGHGSGRGGRRRTLSCVLLLVGAGPLVSAPVPYSSDFAAVERFADIESQIVGSNAMFLAGEGKVRNLLARHRETIESCSTHSSFAQAVNRLIGDIGLSHFHYYTDEDWQYWHLRSYSADDSSEHQVEHAGIIPQKLGTHWFVRGILEGSPADGKGLRLGDQLLSVDGAPYSPVKAFRGTAGRPVKVRVRRGPDRIHEVTLVPKKESLYAAMQRAIRESIDTVRHDEHTFAYLHGWTLLGEGREFARLLAMQDDVDGLLLDYRDGFGGTWHRAELFLLGDSDKPVSVPDHTWTKPVVILTGEGTRSAKEIVMHAVKKAQRAPLVGEPTPGHVISVGEIAEIGDDGLLMLPGYRFDGMEGNPVLPDFLIPRDIRYCGGEDVQMDFAKDLLGSLIRRENAGLTGSWDDAVRAMPSFSKAP